MVKINTGSENYLRYGNHTGACNSFTDPHTDVFTRLNQLVFRMGAFAAIQKSPSYLESHMDSDLLTAQLSTARLRAYTTFTGAISIGSRRPQL